MKVTIDRPECTSCAACWDTCPQVFAENADDGYSELLAEFRQEGDLGKGEVPERLRDCAIEAAESCPVEIIHVQG